MTGNLCNFSCVYNGLYFEKKKRVTIKAYGENHIMLTFYCFHGSRLELALRKPTNMYLKYNEAT